MRKLALIWFAAAVLAAQAGARQPAQPGGAALLGPPLSYTQLPQLSPAGSVPLVPLQPTLTPPTLSTPFAPPSAPAPPLNENLRTFDPATLELSWANGRWQLTASGLVLKDFGRKEAEGQAALRLARALRLSQYGTIGSPAPLMEYWLADGAAPRGPVPGYSLLTFDAASLHVEGSLGQWCLRDGRRVLFNFGTRAAEARQALGVMRKYGFNQVAVVGQMAPSMLVFLADKSIEGEGRVDGGTNRNVVNHETPEVAARKAEELQKLKERVPGLDADSVTQPALRTLRTPDQPRLPFSGTVREFGGEGPTATNPSSGTDAGDRVAFDWRRVQAAPGRRADASFLLLPRRRDAPARRPVGRAERAVPAGRVESTGSRGEVGTVLGRPPGYHPRRPEGGCVGSSRGDPAAEVRPVVPRRQAGRRLHIPGAVALTNSTGAGPGSDVV